MTLEAFLAETAVILAAAIAVLLVSRRLRLPPVVGYLLTGVLIGPSGLAWVPDAGQVELFAEIGVVLLLFSIGLEFSPARLKGLRRPFLLGGSVQVALTVAAGLGGALGLGLASGQALFLGFVVALSSTAVILKLYSDRGELHTPQGRQSLGILLFQDFMVVPMIVLVPVLAGAVTASAAELTARLLVAAAGIAALFVAGRFLLPPLLHELVRTRVREVILLSSLLLCLTLALLTEHLHLSLALGAFLAGILLSDSDYSAQVVADVVPLRDLFTSFFFISIGMLPALDFAADHLPQILGLTLAIVAVKGAAAGVATAISGYPLRIALIVGASLAQIGEFSFVLLKLGREYGLVGEPVVQMILASSVLTILLTPLLLALASRWTLAGEPNLERVRDEGKPGLADHVVIAGYGASGRHLGRVLKEARIPYVIIDLNGEIVRGALREGEPMIFGDATRVEILDRAALHRARILVLAISDDAASGHVARIARRLQPSIYVVARTRTIGQIEELRRAGADEVIADEFETSIELFTRVLHRYHVPRNIVRAQTRALRGESYRMLRAPAFDLRLAETLVEILAAGTTDVFHLAPGSPAIGRTLGDLDLRARSGVMVFGVVRGERPHPNPGSNFQLLEGDELVLVGGHAEVEAAFRLLERSVDDEAD
jgi:CPA2 family monovalent cation:H+ antiporter-2